MISKILLIAVIACVGVVAAVIYGFVTGRISLGDGGGGIIPVTAMVTTPENEVADAPDTLVIEIHESRIVHDGEEISLDELDEIVARYAGGNSIWVLQDAFRANNATFNQVRTLLREHNIIFAEQ